MIAKTQWTRIFGVLLCCALMLGILPVTACTDVTPPFLAEVAELKLTPG